MSPLKRILICSSYFYPQTGGGEKVILNWARDFAERGHEVCVITTVRGIKSDELEFPFELIRLRQDSLHFNPNSEEYISQVVKPYKNNSDESKKLMDKVLEILHAREDYDYYIGYGAWASDYVYDSAFGGVPYTTSLVELIKLQYPKMITISAEWDIHGKERYSKSDYIVNLAPYELIKNYNFKEKNNQRLVLLPKYNDKFNYSGDFEAWLDRPYDFVCNHLSLIKGGQILLELASNFPNKKFLIKKGFWGLDNYLGSSNILEKIKELDNITIMEAIILENDEHNLSKDFYQQGRYFLYPSILEGFGLMAMEAAQQGTIPLCSDINILRYSSAPFAEFVFSEELGFNPLIHFCQDYFELFSMDYKIISEAWIEKINHLEEHPSIQMMLFQNLNYVNGFLEKRYEDSVGSFFTHLHNRQELEKNLIVYHYDNKKRFGNNTDGGYVTGVLEGKYDCYISAGIGDDESFTADFLKKHNYLSKIDCHAFDGTISDYPLKGPPYANSVENYTHNIQFHQKNIGGSNNDVSTNLRDIISTHEEIFIKMDIENFEYEWLLSLEKSDLKRIKQIVIEFHGIDSSDSIYSDSKINFIDKIKALEKINNTHYLIHAHGNVFGSNNQECIYHRPMPEVIELTFVIKDYFKEKPPLNTKKFPFKDLDYSNGLNHSFVINCGYGYNLFSNDWILDRYPFVAK
jgi:glycosyltransferase involved in cell wall biosynthesis